MRVIVVGAGICGASAAYWLACQGAEVTILEERDGPADGVTAGAMGWINGTLDINPADTPALYRCRLDAIKQHYSLKERFGERWPLQKTGSILWEEKDADTEAFFRIHSEGGAAIRLLTGYELTELLPELHSPPSVAVLLEDDGTLETVMAVRTLLEEAELKGAQCVYNSCVQSLLVEEGRVRGVQIEGRHLFADAIVLANAVDINRLLLWSKTHQTIDTSPAVLVWFEAVPGFQLNQIVASPAVEVRQLADGRLQVCDLAENREEAELIKAAGESLQRTFKGLENLRPLGCRISGRPIPRNTWPLDYKSTDVEGLWTLSLHPGVIMAPYVAKQLADEIIGICTD